MQIFGTEKFLILQKNKSKYLKGWEGLCGRWLASPNLGPLVHTVYSSHTKFGKVWCT